MKRGFSLPSSSSRPRIRFEQGIAFLLGTTLCAALILIALLVFDDRGDASPFVAATAGSPQFLDEISVLIPEERVPAGDKLRASSFRKDFVPRDLAPEGAIKSFQDIDQAYATRDIPAGIPLVASSVSFSPLRSGPSTRIPEGERLITVMINETGRVEDLVQPGDRVDVVASINDPVSGMIMTDIVSQNIVIHSVDRRQTARSALEETLRRHGKLTTVSLRVTPQDGLRIRQADRLGEISFMLRNPTDLKHAQTDRVLPHDLTKSETPQVSPVGTLGQPLGHAEWTDNQGRQQNRELIPGERRPTWRGVDLEMY